MTAPLLNPHSEIARFMRVVWGKAFNVNGSIAMLQGYMGCFDCSTDEAANIPKPVTVVAGFATSLEKWEQWETNWRLVLAEFHAPYFHMKEFFDTRKGAFAEPRWRSEKYRNKFIEALSNVTSDWMLVTVGGLMDHHLFEQASLVCKVSGIFNPFSACGRDCAVRTRDLIRGKYKSDLPIAYVFERGDPGPEMLDRLMLRSELPSPLFKRPRPAENPALEKEDPHLSQLQAADLLAWHMRRASHDGGLNRESFDASIKVFHRIPDRSWKECTKEHMVTLLHSLEAERIPITEFEKFDATVRQVFSVPHSEIVKREKEYQRKRKRIREKRIKTIKVSR